MSDIEKLGEMLRVEQVAERLNIKPSTVRAWLLRRVLSRVRVSKRAIRIPASEVERIISQGFVPAREVRQ
jgi:excisionase family DNA binding protein